MRLARPRPADWPTVLSPATDEPRRARTDLTVAPVVVGAALVALLAGAALMWFGRDRYAHTALNASRVDSLRIEAGGRAGFDSVPPIVGVSSLVTLIPTGPITLLDVQPYRVTPGVEVLAVRAVFHGPGVTPGGYRRSSGLPGVTCGPDRTPTGFGPSYPTAGLSLVPGDTAGIVFYARQRAVGHGFVTGYRIRYRTVRGKVRTVFGDVNVFEMNLLAPTAANRQTAQCDPRFGGSWDLAASGFPG